MALIDYKRLGSNLKSLTGLNQKRMQSVNRGTLEKRVEISDKKKPGGRYYLTRSIGVRVFF